LLKRGDSTNEINGDIQTGFYMYSVVELIQGTEREKERERGDVLQRA
jgi:hypothetical protein